MNTVNGKVVLVTGGNSGLCSEGVISAFFLLWVLGGNKEIGRYGGSEPSVEKGGNLVPLLRNNLFSLRWEWMRHALIRILEFVTT